MTAKDNSWVLVTGASSGLGEEFARQYAAQGRPLVLVARRLEKLQTLQGVQNFAVYSAAKAYVLRLAEALNCELKRDGIIVTAPCPDMSDTGFAAAAQQKITPALKLLMMQPAPVVRAGIRALQAGRTSVVPGWGNKAFRVLRLGHAALGAPAHYRSCHGCRCSRPPLTRN